MATYSLDENYMNTTTAQPQSPPPQTRVTGGTAPVNVQQPITIKPNQINPTTGQLMSPTGTATTGGNAPIQTAVPTQGAVTGGNGQQLPNTSAIPSFQLPALDGSSYVAQNTTQAPPQASPYDVVTQNMNRLLAGDSAYIQNARLRGAESAQARGLRNSSIAAGASERAAIESAQPILNEIQDLTSQREQLAFTGQENALDRLQQVNSQILQAEVAARQAMQDFQFQRTLQGDSVLQQDWLNSQNFTREFNAQLATLPITNAASLSNLIAQYAIENPEVYTPEVISGMQSFFTGSFIALMQQYFPNLGYGTTAPTGG